VLSFSGAFFVADPGVCREFFLGKQKEKKKTGKILEFISLKSQKDYRRNHP